MTARVISSSMRMRASRAPARTATSCGMTRISWLKAAWSRASQWAHMRRISMCAANFITKPASLQRAVDEAYERGLIGKNACGIRLGFRCVCASGRRRVYLWRRNGLIESLEGKKGQPRLKPPFPAMAGLYGRPTTVNNVETIAVAPTILRRGADWFVSFGRENNARHQGLLHFRACECTVQCRRSHEHSDAGADREACRRRARRLG